MQPYLLGEESQRLRLSQLGDSLEKLNVVDFEIFRPILMKGLCKERKSSAGRPSYDVILMFKILILERLFNLSDEQTEYQITDRVSFQRFLGLSLGARVPDAKTIWLFKDALAQKGVIEVLFKEFNSQLESKGLITHTGTIIDATFVNAPRQRNTRDENQAIKQGEVPENWASNPHKMAQKDRDARWTRKNTETHYGYKAHVKVDMDSKLVTSYSTTSASVHDSNEFVNFLDETDQVVYADSAYSGQEIPAHIRSEVCEKGCRNKKLSETQKANNRRKSKVRRRIEHVFGFMTCSMRGITVRSIGLRRAEFNVGLTNLVYNLFRYSFLAKKETI